MATATFHEDTFVTMDGSLHLTVVLQHKLLIRKTAKNIPARHLMMKLVQPVMSIQC
ncbi:MAG: hypothetical protein IJW77_16075 [Clostridia bacterium]|nr:hypothetical protein [Clostridia bacterium]